MTPAARIQAAIEVLDTILTGVPGEKALTGWARRSRYAGSKDRAAVRDHVFDALRCKNSFAALGGTLTGRGLMLGQVRAANIDVQTVFTGGTYAPAALTDQELIPGAAPDGLAALDVPDWLWPRFQDSLGDGAEACAKALRHRAPVHLRVNVAKTDRATAQARLSEAGIETQPHPAASTALAITEGARKLRQSEVYLDGSVELQDAASQAVVEGLPLADGQHVLDFCAGGGGKTLAMAARARLDLVAHDVAPDRMRDLPVRAARAGASVISATLDELQDRSAFDLVLCDAPCSGSGAWRRAPEGKWALTPARLSDLMQIQDDILDQVTALVAPSGCLAYVTCSLFRDENQDTITRFLERYPDWTCTFQQAWAVTNDTDGFFVAHLFRAT